MRKEVANRIFLVVLCSLLMVSFVSAADNPLTQSDGALTKIREVIVNLFEGTTGYDYFSNILSPQVLLGVLVFFVIFAVIRQISLFKGNNWLTIGVSIVVSILAAGFINNDWIAPILNQYEAIGVTISLLVPFILLFYFLKEIAPHNSMVQRFIWVVYFVVVIVNAFMNWSKIDNILVKWIYVALIVLALIMIIWNKKILEMMFKEQLQTAMDKYDDVQKFISAGRKAEAQAALYSIGTQLPESRKRELERMIKDM